MEHKDNIMLICKECVEKVYPNKGKLTVDIGKFAKLKFTDGHAGEYMWVMVIAVNKRKEEYEGRVDNDPILVTNVKYGDKVKFKKEDVFDVM